jgi:lysophospholipase L1-like esterase
MFWIGNLLLILGGILIAILVLETFAITTGFTINDYYKITHKYFYEFLQPDEKLGYIPQPNLKNFNYYWIDETKDAVINTDNYGFRNLGRDYADSNLYFVGDSFTWGWGIDREKTFYGLLESELNQPIVTLGIPGYGFEQYQVLFKDWISKYKPKTVILCLYANDLEAVKPLKEMNKTYQTLGATEYETLDWYQKSLIYKFIIKKGVFNLSKMLFTGKKAENGLLLHNQKYMTYQLVGTSRDYLTSTDHIQVENALSQIIDLTQENQINLLIFCIPTKESTYIEEYAQLFPGSIDYLRNEEIGFQQLCQLAQNKQVPCIDLTLAFRENSGDAKWYFDMDSHWNAAGHQLAAELISDTLMRLEKTGLGRENG